MDRFLPKIYLDFNSFWAGILIAAIVLFLALRYRKHATLFIKTSYLRVRSLRNKISISSGSDYPRVLYKYIQTKHIASMLFPLDAILIPPKCIASPPALTPGEDTFDPSLLQQTLGYDPALPELAIEYFTPTFTLAEAITKGANLVLLGYPGTGKTVAIADCISSLLKGKHDFPELQNRIPLLVEAQQILTQFPGSDVLEILITAIQTDAAFSTVPKLPEYLTTTLNSENAILFIDGFDSLNHINADRIANYLVALCKKIPHLQIIIAASPNYLGNLEKASFEIVSISHWGKKEEIVFLKKWSSNWTEYLTSSDSAIDYKNQILNKMLSISNQYSTPLEFTLSSWAAYAGDLTGSKANHAIQAFLNRITGTNSESSFRALENIAVLLLDEENDSFSKRDINTLFSKKVDSKPTATDSEKSSPINREVQIALAYNILQKTGPDRFYFANPSIAGFLAARGLVKTNTTTINRVLSKIETPLYYETMRFFSVFNKVDPYLGTFLSDQSLFKEKLIHICHWLSYSNLATEELVPVLKSITSEIHNNQIYLVKLRLLIALAKSGNPNIKNIIRHLLTSKDQLTKRAAAICAGYIQDLGSVPLLIDQLNDPFPCSTAACYALGKIGSPNALDAVAESLLHGDELLRRSAAESLSHNRSEGHPALREGATMEDLLVRYAVVHGLGQINEDWAIDILDKMRIDEDEWIVRDLAQHVFEILHTGSPFIPRPQTPLHQAAWLRSFSQQHNLAMLSIETALELLLKALEIGSGEQKQAAIPYLRRIGGKEALQALIHALDDPDPDVQQYAATALWFSTPPGYQPQVS